MQPPSKLSSRERKPENDAINPFLRSNLTSLEIKIHNLFNAGPVFRRKVYQIFSSYHLETKTEDDERLRMRAEYKRSECEANGEQK